MNMFILGLALFFVPHFYSNFRSRSEGQDLRVKLGYSKFMGLYSVISIIGFVLMIWGFGQMRPSAAVFTPPSWGKHATMLLMIPAFILLAGSHGPTGHIKNFVKHPMLIATILWAGSHLLANGELNSAILFGAFLLYAIVNFITVSKRPLATADVSAKADVIQIIVGLVIYGVFAFLLHPILIGVAVA